MIVMCRLPYGRNIFRAFVAGERETSVATSMPSVRRPERLHDIAEGDYCPVNGRDPVDTEMAPADILQQIRSVRLYRGARAVDVGFDQKPLSREVGHQQRIGVRAPGDVVKREPH